MAVSVSKLEHLKLETEFHNGYVVHTTYEWGLTARLWKATRWKQVKKIGMGAFGSVWLEEESEGKLRAVKRLPRDSVPGASFLQELLALVKLKDVSSPRNILPVVRISSRIF